MPFVHGWNLGMEPHMCALKPESHPQLFRGSEKPASRMNKRISINSCNPKFQACRTSDGRLKMAQTMFTMVCHRTLELFTGTTPPPLQLNPTQMVIFGLPTRGRARPQQRYYFHL